MTLAEILADEELRRHEFPVARDKIYLGHAGVSPLPRRVAEALEEFVRHCSTTNQGLARHAGILENGRRLGARLLGCQPEEITLVGPTSLALSIIAGGIQWKKGDEVLVYFDDYPSNVYPWMALAERGVEVRWLKTAELGEIRLEDVKAQVTGQTRLVTLATCHFITGLRVDIEGTGKFLRERGILFCLDGIQTVGAFPTPVAHVDFLAAGGHKWLLGPCGPGLLYVRRELQETLQPPVLGWHNVRCPNYVTQEKIEFRAGGPRFEVGTQNMLGQAGLNAAMELLLEIGVENIGAELLRKRKWLVPALQAKGYEVVAAGAGLETASGMVTFNRKDGANLTALNQKLEVAGVYGSLREDRAGRQYIRFSPHFYNTDAELRRVLEML